MKSKFLICLAAWAIVFLSTAAWADQIIFRDGTVFSGKFIRGDSKTVDFRVLGRIESFKVADISQIIFKDPELVTSTGANTTASPVVSPRPENSPPERELRPSTATQKIPAESGSASTATLPAGTSIVIRTSTEIDTDRNRVGDVFDATLDEALVWEYQTVAPRGSTVKGRIAYAQESGKLTGRSQLILELTELVVKGKSYSLRTSDYTEVGSSRGKRTATTVGGTAALGAIIGAIAGGGKGAAVGAASGAAVGTGVQVLTRGEVLRVPAETVIEFKLQSPMTVNVP